jgi:hypothetical protein
VTFQGFTVVTKSIEPGYIRITKLRQFESGCLSRMKSEESLAEAKSQAQKNHLAVA